MSEKYTLSLQLASHEDTLKLGERISGFLTPNCTIYLQGDLGVGKTTLAKGLLAGLGYQQLVKSPTYTIVETYNLTEHSVHHLDLYRLDEPESLEFMGVRAYFGDHSIRIIEWPEMGGNYIPQPDLKIILEIAPGNQVPAKSDKLIRTAQLYGICESMKTQWDAITDELACFNPQ